MGFAARYTELRRFAGKIRQTVEKTGEYCAALLGRYEARDPGPRRHELPLYRNCYRQTVLQTGAASLAASLDRKPFTIVRRLSRE